MLTFSIYQDVIVQHPDGRVDIFGYPLENFPPTDFHSATLVGDRIILIGNLGYQHQRHPGRTQVLALDTKSWRVTQQPTSGENPGWIHDHHATISENGSCITISNGKLVTDPDSSILENIDDWQLNLHDWKWTRLTKRDWPRWEVTRQDGEPNNLWEMRQAEFHEQMRKHAKTDDLELPEFRRASDPMLLEKLYVPPLDCEPIPPSAEQYNVYRVKLDGIIVRYVEDMDSIMITIEGKLDQTKTDTIVENLCEKLGKLEGTIFTAKRR